MTQHGRGAAGPQETAARPQPADPWPAYAPRGAPEADDVFDDVADRPGQTASGAGTAVGGRPADGPATAALPVAPGLAGRPRPARRSLPGRAEHPGAGRVPRPGTGAPPGAARPRPLGGHSRAAAARAADGDRVKGSVERWSRWASGLGLPARDGSGYGRYAKADRLLPPAVWIAAGLGAAGLVGLLTGVLVSAPSGGAPAAAAAVTSTATVTVTEQVTQPPVTQTTTRTRTKTVTATTTAAAPAQAPGAGGTLGPGSQGGQVARLQADLAALGLFQGPPNGSYDQRTALGVQAFQASTACRRPAGRGRPRDAVGHRPGTGALTAAARGARRPRLAP